MASRFQNRARPRPMTGSVPAATKSAAMAFPPSGPPGPTPASPAGRRPSGPSAPRPRTRARPRDGCRPRRRGRRASGSSGCGGEGIRHEQGLHHRQRAPAPVERVRAGVCVADGVEPEHRRSAVDVDEAADPVDEPTHRSNRTPRLEHVGREELVGTGQRPAGALEAIGVGERDAQVAVVGPDRERHRQGRAVAGDRDVLHEAEVAHELRVDHRERSRRGGGTTGTGT